MTVKDYFFGDELAADVWQSKYKGEDEKTPKDMHRRMAKELGRVDAHSFFIEQPGESELSEFGEKLRLKLAHIEDTEMKKGKKDGADGFTEWIMEYLDGFRYIVPQGSIMTVLGNKKVIGSLSNCFVIPSPVDSYGGILKTDQQLVQLMKRRGGVGMNLNTLRPSGTPVSNVAKTSTGADSFMDRYSNSTREVAQDGRRGALMLLLLCLHPDIFKYVNKKKDRTKVTGANISVMLTDLFMEAVKGDEDFMCQFPVDEHIEVNGALWDSLKYNELFEIQKGKYVMKIRAQELYTMIVENAWDNAEPGVAFIDRIKNYCPEGVYPQYVPIASNPCGEQWMQAFDACRLLALNLFSVVKNPFYDDAEIDYEKLYEVSYIQQRLADDIVDLEIEYVDRIIAKIKQDPEPEDVKKDELELWIKIKNVAQASRRTGCGFTALGDMLAAIGLRYDSEAALEVVKKVMQTKMRAELDCTIDLAILRGEFEGYNPDLEFTVSKKKGEIIGKNDVYEMIANEFPDQAKRMFNYGRRNVSWSTVAPTGTVSILTQTTSGLEPLFLPYYIRKKKINANDASTRVDYVDQNGDSWQEFTVFHPKFKDWIQQGPGQWIEDEGGDYENITKELAEDYFKRSPWYGSCANDIAWEKRIEMQSVIQKYTTNAISSTMNLPKDVSKETVSQIYKTAWEYGLKGVTIYRDGCRSGVLTSGEEKKSQHFDYKDAVKRPTDLEADLHVTTVKGEKYAVIVGTMEGKPYEVFAFEVGLNGHEVLFADEGKLKSTTGKLSKIKKGQYDFISEKGTLKAVQEEGVRHDELVLTRLISGMLRHGAKPQFVMEQIDKCDLEVVSFGKAVSRILKKYVNDGDMVARNSCKDCSSKNVRMQEGCLTCLDCGSSKCG